MEPGDVLVAYTDGIVEPENEYDEMFGEERLAGSAGEVRTCGLPTR